MGRWEPNARGRLEQAALELYVERGYEQTPVAEITKRAGLTERTFFRHFTDKREVLFAGSGRLEELCVAAVAAAPTTASPMEAVAAALDAAAGAFEERGDLVGLRQGVIDANAELRERELIKLASLSGALADALRGRGVAEPAAELTAESAIAVLKVAFRRWIDGGRERPLRPLLAECFDVLRTLSARGAASAG
ncbi:MULTISPECIES: TetR/AcrR family transcriptional regulator [Streptomyces]|uniref:Helix-turn-helix domain-containing protein n=3 Tax=Streptomyces violaceoruber group TaxID=2867121 RepID=A0ACD4WZ06_STRVN|nr:MULTISPECIES: TetR/AcrR family transcriptional regulator [Streptomyces]WOZ02672.1 helix-turn-helix domain-containing protein [Streptomyces violaceoruber]BDD69878.1 TetR family transcriptional regulator [Streptomyces coelicolor]MCW8116588.1 TetR/AcrR family transcriptional regulator [Streptomyces anthocyanicus]MCZ4634502.1 helix-turn-helix domain containing protein [Streptomyces rubrogriseus]MDX3316463.1 helix-turn-helix domain containing protein [Streptomyces sp. ME03-5684b]